MGQHGHTERVLLNAAWACDDQLGPNSEASWVCRRCSLEADEKSRAGGSASLSKKGTNELVQVDMLRRIGDFQAAIALAEETLRMELKPFRVKIAKAQIRFANTRDAQVHTMVEV
jgi:hypothetical protein